MGEKDIATGEIKVNPNIMAYIQVAVNQGIEAGLKIAKKKNAVITPLNPFSETEKRLRALPILTARVVDKKEELKDLEERNEVNRRSKDICRFGTSSGLRLTPEEILDELKADIKSQIARDEHEIEIIKSALEIIKGNKYYPAVEGKYFQYKDDADKELAKELKCEERTVSRGRVQLVQMVAVRLYGSDAVRK